MGHLEMLNQMRNEMDSERGVASREIDSECNVEVASVTPEALRSQPNSSRSHMDSTRSQLAKTGDEDTGARVAKLVLILRSMDRDAAYSYEKAGAVLERG